MNAEGSANVDSTSQNNSDNNDINPKKLLEFGSKQIISLFVPVSICMLMVGIVAKTVNYYSTSEQFFIYTPFHTKNADVGTTLWQSLANALIMMSFIVVMSVLLVLLYKYRCYKFIHGYLIVSTVMILFVVFTLFFIQVIIATSIFMDYITMALIIWNIGIMGFLVIHWKGPLIMQQTYLIVISANVALILLKFMPQWTTWVILAALAIWDLVAVLCPFGPLRILVDIATERNEPIFPALIYSTTATMMVNDDNNRIHAEGTTSGHMDDMERDLLPPHAVTIKQHNPSPRNRNVRKRTDRHKVDSSEVAATDPPDPPDHRGTINDLANEHVLVNDTRSRAMDNIRHINDDVMNRGDRGVKLGLGDFVFYSLLMGRATLGGDSNTILACYVAILIGMFLTILLLTVSGRALPALPISMACGILFYFTTSLIISPFTNALVLSRVFI